ncbi:flagellar hook-associated protein 1 FlgK [Rhodovulum sp. ES.010]|uniref:flagellar hook-associated protein FlgK n=1 Tax=Rhodovulum sp. ES.010 TaxID=1882821 RepID=UPI00092AA25B|nr:flagellar hook-associated protein FlgK [Rhodovulum sp. ES.010]SIO49730.1 flagellar hook-associated protein 1 FlgK [Rhodovulum sp. ES.010]
MSLSSSLSNALSGLNASSRGAQVVSSNISNALTEGYGRRVLETSASTVMGAGSGVQVDGVRRDTNLALISDRRLSQSDLGQAQTRADGLARVEAALGTPDSPDSIAGRMAALESALVAAASRPDSATRLADVKTAAQSVAGSIQMASDDLQSIRMQADSAIAGEVELLNGTLREIADLNTEIRSHYGTRTDMSALFDERQVLVDRIAEVVPLRQIQRDHGTIALYTETGAALVDGRASEFSFDQVGVITPDMTIASGALSGLTLNGEPVRAVGSHAPMGGGRLEALFEQRDQTVPAAQANLDALARDLIERFEAPGVDPSATPGAPGLFTDNGLVLDPANELGLSARISVNATVDPDQGGDLWRLRTGLGAPAAGDVGDSTLLNAFADALSNTRVPSSGTFGSQPMSASGLATEAVSRISVQAHWAAEEEGFASARTNALKEAELQGGVDTDAELQNLMLYEQAYAANAKVIQAVDEMMQMLMEI